MEGGDVGVVISSCMMLTGMIQWGMRQSAEMENLMTSVERVLEYGRIQSEADLVVQDHAEREKVKDWPGEDSVLEFRDVWLRYAEEDKYVLKGLDFKTKPKEKVRTV